MKYILIQIICLVTVILGTISFYVFTYKNNFWAMIPFLLLIGVPALRFWERYFKKIFNKELEIKP